MILKFDEFIQINEGSNESVVTLSKLKKTLEPFGWTFTHSNGGDNVKASKGKYTNNGHLKHGNRSDDNRKIDMGYLNRLRKMLLDEFYETGDLSTIKAIDWDEWRLSNPLNKELKDYNPETGEKIEKESELNVGQKLSKARIEKSITNANELYKDAALWKIDNNDEKSAYIISTSNERGVVIYNTCKSIEDRRPLLKKWTSDYIEKNGMYLFGRDYMRGSIYQIRYYRVLSDGNLGKDVEFIEESKKYEKNIEKNLVD